MAKFAKKVKKALVAGGLAGVSAAVAAAPDGITTKEWGVVAGAVVVAVLAVFKVENAPWKADAK